MRNLAAVLATLCVALAACGGGVAAAPAMTMPASPLATARPSAATAVTPPPAVRAFPPAESFASTSRAVRAAQPPAVAATRRLNAPADYCVDRDVAAAPARDVVLTVLDRTHMLTPGYAPPDLVPASAAGYAGAQGAKLVRGAIVDDLAALRRDSAAAGLSIQLQSTYRSYASQVSTFNHWLSVYGTAGALLRSARPGHSEHQLGTTIDFTSPGWGGRFGNWATETREGAWLAANGWRYGFVMSYPLGTQATTCFSYEPWHYRWIGRAPAAAWHASGETLHAFLTSLGG